MIGGQSLRPGTQAYEAAEYEARRRRDRLLFAPQPQKRSDPWMKPLCSACRCRAQLVGSTLCGTCK